MTNQQGPAVSSAGKRVVVTVPTYNESANILRLAHALLALGPNIQVLVVDDHSPDGTWEMVAKEGRKESRLKLLHRTTDKGRGRAGRAGFLEALGMGADVVVEMDADFSHQPRFIPALLERLDRPGHEVGLVLGSRAIVGGGDADRGTLRRWFTKLANLYIRVLLGVPVQDCNSGFRAWRRSTLETIEVARTFSAGPSIVQELLFKTARKKIAIAEVPIEFIERAQGESTLTLRLLMQGYWMVLKLRWMALLGQI